MDIKLNSLIIGYNLKIHGKCLDRMLEFLLDFMVMFGNMRKFFSLRFFVTNYSDNDGKTRYSWQGGEQVLAVASDVPIPGTI